MGKHVKVVELCEGADLVIERLVKCSILPLQLMNFLIELGLNMSTFHLQVLQSVHSPLHDLRQTAGWTQSYIAQQ